MIGTVSVFDPHTLTGWIADDEGNRYDFALADWHNPSRPQPGAIVDFASAGTRAIHIYLIAQGYVPNIVGFYLLPRGRISRSQYWLKWAIPIVAITLLFRIAVVAGYQNGAVGLARSLWIASVVFNFAILWPGAAVLAKRIHDRDKPGWLAAVFYAPVVLYTIAARLFLDPAEPSLAFGAFALAMLSIFLYFVVEFGFFRGTVGQNQYGPDPCRPTSSLGTAASRPPDR
jgi:uncharacterized membrane protein YhaH (DUF805 family)